MIYFLQRTKTFEVFSGSGASINSVLEDLLRTLRCSFFLTEKRGNNDKAFICLDSLLQYKGMRKRGPGSCLGK